MNLSRLGNSLSLKSRFNRDVFWNVISLGILGASGMVVNAVILAGQGKESLGVFNQVFALFIIASQLSVGGVQFSVLKHCSYEQGNPALCSAIVSSALMLVALAGIAICPILFLLRETVGHVLDSPSVAAGWGFAVPGVFFFALNKVLMMALNGLRHMRAFAVFQTARYILVLAGVMLIMARGCPASYLALSLTGAEVVLFAALMIYINISLFPIRFSFSAAARAWCRRHVSFGARGLFSGVLIETNTRVDVLLLGCFLSDALVGVYSFGSTFAEGFAQLSIVIRQNIDPLLGKAFADRDHARIEDIARRVRGTFFPIMLLLGGALVAGFPLILWGLRHGSLQDPAWGSWGVFAILVAGTVIGAGYRPLIALILQGGRPGAFTLLMAGSVAANVLLNLALIPVLGIYGSALATAIVYVLEACAIVVLARKLFGIRL